MTVLFRSEHSDRYFFFDRKALRDMALRERSKYRDAKPFPHVVFDDFLGEEMASSLANAFPGPTHPGWLRRDYAEQSARLGQLQRTDFDGVDTLIRNLLAELNGMAFLDFLEKLTGIEGLIPDPHFRGAGPALILPGGHLSLHADFNRDRSRHLARKLTAIYYLGKDWESTWGGALELWDEPRNECVRYLPILDRLIVMDHGDTYWHGQPEPLTCPADRFRASVGAYYYVAESSENAAAHGAIWTK